MNNFNNVIVNPSQGGVVFTGGGIGTGTSSGILHIGTPTIPFSYSPVSYGPFMSTTVISSDRLSEEEWNDISNKINQDQNMNPNNGLKFDFQYINALHFLDSDWTIIQTGIKRQREKKKEYRYYTLKLTIDGDFVLIKKLTKDDFWMEDVRNLSLNVNEELKSKLKNYNIVLTDKQEETIYEAVWAVLEDVSNGNYRKNI